MYILQTIRAHWISLKSVTLSHFSSIAEHSTIHYMYVLYVVIVTYKSSLAGRGLYNTTVFILMFTNVTLINITNQPIINISQLNRCKLKTMCPCKCH